MEHTPCACLQKAESACFLFEHVGPSHVERFFRLLAALRTLASSQTPAKPSGCAAWPAPRVSFSRVPFGVHSLSLSLSLCVCLCLSSRAPDPPCTPNLQSSFFLHKHCPTYVRLSCVRRARCGGEGGGAGEGARERVLPSLMSHSLWSYSTNEVACVPPVSAPVISQFFGSACRSGESG